MTKQTVVLVGLGVIALVVWAIVTRPSFEPHGSTFTLQTLESVDGRLAAKAEDSCWFKIKSQSAPAGEVNQWRTVSSTGVKTQKLGELLIVTGAMEPAVRDDRFYGCSLFQYTNGTPVVMTAKTSPNPVRASNVVPYGFSDDGKKQLQ